MVFEIHDAQALFRWAECAIDDVLSIRSEGCKCVVVRARCDDVEVRSIGIHNADLRSSVDGIHRFLSTRLKIEKRGEDPDADNDLLTVWRPARRKNQALLLQDHVRGFALIHNEQAGFFARGAYPRYGQVFSGRVVGRQPRRAVEIEFWIFAELLYRFGEVLHDVAAEDNLRSIG